MIAFLVHQAENSCFFNLSQMQCPWTVHIFPANAFLSSSYIFHPLEHVWFEASGLGDER